MEDSELFTVKVFQVEQDLNGQAEMTDQSDMQPSSSLELHNKHMTLGNHPNMISARVIKGRMVELQHSQLVGPSVKFKTIINYDQALEKNKSIGVAFFPQSGYITHPSLQDTTPS